MIVSVSLPGYVVDTPNFKKELLFAFVTHVLYMRGMIPLPFDRLQQTCATNFNAELINIEQAQVGNDAPFNSNGHESSCRVNEFSDSRLSNKVFARKQAQAFNTVKKFVASMESCFEYLTQDIQQFLLTACLLIGPSAISAKEVYQIHFHISDSSSSPRVFENEQVVLDKVKRKLIRTLVLQDWSSELKNISSMNNIFIALGFDHSTSKENSNLTKAEITLGTHPHNSKDDRESYECCEHSTKNNIYEEPRNQTAVRVSNMTSASVQGCTGFLNIFTRKDTFKFRKNSLFPLEVNALDNEDNEQNCEGCRSDQIADLEWFLTRRGIKGLR